MKAVLECQSIRHTYGKGDLAEPVLKGIDLQVFAGDCAVLTGPSGSGKTTLLCIAGCLLTPSEGELRVAGEAVHPATHRNLTRLRREKIGFVFQHAQLLPFLTVRQNLEIVGRNAGLTQRDANERISMLLEKLEMDVHAGKNAAVLSGGQRQRVAVARALIHRPAIVLADEPTAALGWEIGQAVVDLLTLHAKQEGAGLLVVTHDMRLLPKFERRWDMAGGKVEEIHE
jgi:ABC-type lipoprotein export system ATPase subunit